MSGKESFEKSFFAGGRAMSGLVLGILMMATMTSSGTLVSAHGLSYRFGLGMSVVGLSAAAGFFIVLAGLGKKIGIVSRRCEAISITGLLKSRYNNNRVLVVVLALIFLIFLSVYSAAQIMGGARVFEFMTGESYVIGLLLFGIIVGVYTLVGGMKSVATAGLFQGLIMVFATLFFAIAMFVYAGNHYGGMANLLQTFAGTEYEAMISSSPGMAPTALITMLVMILYCVIGQPHVIQGTMTYRNTQSLKQAVVVGLIASSIIGVGLMLIGPMARAIDPQLEAVDFASPLLAFTVMPAPLTGVLLAGVTAAIQSTIAGMMLIVSSAIAKEVYKDIINPAVSEKKLKGVSLGVLAVTNDHRFADLHQSAGRTAAPRELCHRRSGLGADCSLLFGLFWRRTNEYGAITGCVLGLVVYIVAQLNQAALFGVNPFIFGILASVLATIVVSLATPKPPRGIIEVWFGKTYDKAFALSRTRVK
jgi:sodium/pantothenate symporter